MVRMLPIARTRFEFAHRLLERRGGRLSTTRVDPMNTAPQHVPAKPLAGWRVLVPRGGPWGDGVAATLRRQGATPVDRPAHQLRARRTTRPTLEQALADLAAGAFDWLTVTSATTVDVLYAYRADDPRRRRRSPPSARPPRPRSWPSATASTSFPSATTPRRAWPSR